MEQYFITMGISTILLTLKNPNSRRKFRSAFLKVFNAIRLAFPDDKDFQ